MEELLEKVNTIFDSNKLGNKNNLDEPLPDVIKKNFFDDELAAEKIIKVWESFTDDKLSSSYDLKKFKNF